MTADLKANWEAVCGLVEDLMKRLNVPGVSLGISVHGEDFVKGFGVTNVDNPLPVTDGTLFQIGSIGKTFTGTAIMRFVDQGKLSLSDPVRKYVPELQTAEPEIAEKVTVRHMLNHMSGWDGDLFVDTGEGPDALPKFIALIKGQNQLAPMDTFWSYNNSGFAVLGRILEVLSGKTYEQVMKEMVFAPLGLENTYLNPWDVMTLRFASGHRATHEGAKVARPWQIPRSAGPAGRVISTAGDMLKYARFHMGEGFAPNGERMMSTETLHRMRTPDVVVFGEMKWALPWGINDSLGLRQVLHSGSTVGQNAEFRFIPEAGLTIVILTNADAGGSLNDKVCRFIYKRYLGLEEPELKPVEAKPEELAEFVGTYSRTADDLTVGTIAGQMAGVLVAKVGFPDRSMPVPPPSPPIPMAKVGKDMLMLVLDPPDTTPIHVIRKPDGKVGWLRVGLRIMKRLDESGVAGR